MELVVASTNEGKLKEIRSTLHGQAVDVVPIGKLVPGFDVDETGLTFLENARLKAMAAFLATGRPSVADDSGLCVEGLALEPGVFSARYAGPGKSDAERVEFLLSRMRGLAGTQRRAYFSCVLYAVLPEGAASFGQDELLSCEPIARGFTGVAMEGRVYGVIGHTPRGTEGFGYDPVFHPDEDPSRTLAQFSTEEKNRFSHRGKAFSMFARMLMNLNL